MDFFCHPAQMWVSYRDSEAWLGTHEPWDCWLIWGSFAWKAPPSPHTQETQLLLRNIAKDNKSRRASIKQRQLSYLALVLGSFHAGEKLLFPQSTECCCVLVLGQIPSSRGWSLPQWVSFWPGHDDLTPVSPEQHPVKIKEVGLLLKIKTRKRKRTNARVECSIKK